MGRASGEGALVRDRLVAGSTIRSTGYHQGMTSPADATPREGAPAPLLRPGDPRLASWRAFLVAHAKVWHRLDEDLRQEHDLTLPEYECLLFLVEAPERRLRMREIADRALLSKSGVTRMVDRLVADGLVERASCPTDARGAEAELTDAGLARLRAASRTHLKGVDDYFLSVLDADQLAVIANAMAAVDARTG